MLSVSSLDHHHEGLFNRAANFSNSYRILLKVKLDEFLKCILLMQQIQLIIIGRVLALCEQVVIAE